mmetsp:Transcript_106450/g.301419  ORF Transcript_106450/g.301419 Transcript_106450/m.301419 type:complete len:117 (+) Transcript_106450:237-587(+)
MDLAQDFNWPELFGDLQKHWNTQHFFEQLLHIGKVAKFGKTAPKLVARDPTLFAKRTAELGSEMAPELRCKGPKTTPRSQNHVADAPIANAPSPCILSDVRECWEIIQRVEQKFER